MSMKKITKKMLAIVAAAAMTVGMAMPAMAADEGATVPDTKNNAKEAYISKTYQTEVKKEMTFNFTATQVTGDNRDDLVKTAVTCTIPNIAFTETDFTSETGTYKKVSQKIEFGDFKEAGKYEYTVKEGVSEPAIINNEYEKLIMSKAEYTMDVYVVEDNGGKFNIEKIIVTKTKNDNETSADGGKVDIGGDASKNGFNFVNTYVQEAGTGENPDPNKPDPDYTENGALKVSKKVIQNVTDAEKSLPTEKFDFTAKFKFPAGTDANTLGGVKDKDGKDVTLDATGQYTFQLGNGENMKFTGLPVGTTITVTEAAKANYKGSAVVTLNGVETSKAATKYNEAITASGKLGQKKNIVDVTNRFNNVPTTGIIMNTLPYVLMIALCGAALTAFVVFKRKKAQR